MEGDRVTLLEAIAEAGDLTLYGKRQNILIVRDYLGTKTYNRVDITQADFVNSPFRSKRPDLCRTQKSKNRFNSHRW
jgi:polysaccharide export outer membrane protein